MSHGNTAISVFQFTEGRWAVMWLDDDGESQREIVESWDEARVLVEGLL
jgi:hypothetical protein